MIVASMQDLQRYRGLSSKLDRAFDWILSEAWNMLPEGKHAIEGEEVYALVQRYETKDPSAGKLEAHRRYIDIQMLAAGEELIRVLPVKGLVPIEPYKPDIEFFSMPEGETFHIVHLRPGILALLFPEDAHMPCIRCGEGALPVTKVVIKVAV